MNTTNLKTVIKNQDIKGSFFFEDLDLDVFCKS